jgi:cation diffusion facilitator family transporter
VTSNGVKETPRLPSSQAVFNAPRDNIIFLIAQTSHIEVKLLYTHLKTPKGTPLIMAHSESKTAILASLAGNGLIAITKFVAAAFTGSSAMLSEGIHSVVDTGNQILLLRGLHLSKKPANDAHPFGFGKEIYFWSFIVAILLFTFGGALSMYEGVKHLKHPEPITDILTNYLVLGFAFIFEGYAFWIAYKSMKKTTKHFHWFRSVNRAKDPSIIVVLLENSAAMLGLLVAFIGITLSYFLDLTYFDAIASMGIGVILLVIAIWLAIESKKLLIGESANPTLVKNITDLLNAAPEIDRVQKVLTLHMGPEEVLVNLYADFKDDISSQQIEETVTQLENKIKALSTDITWVFIAAKSFAKRKNKK